jgi:Fe-S cluster assembly protein SufD
VNTAELPNRRNEAWKYSDLRAAVGDALPPPAQAPTSSPPARELFGGLKPIEIAFVNGRISYWPEKNVRKAPRVLSKGDPDAPRRGGSTLLGGWAAELSPDEWMPIVEASENAQPVWLRMIGDVAPTSAHARIGLVIPAGRTLNVIETYEGPATGFTNVLIEGFVGQGGILNRTVIQDASDKAVLVSTAQINLERCAHLSQCVLAFGAKLARIETHVSVEGEGAGVTLNGAYLAGEGRHADLTSVIEHKAPDGVTRQLIKGVVRKGGRGVFQGKIVVERAAQRTDARQHHQGLLLEDGAEIFAKPELMIHADDVQCAHGNTAGGLDERALFYMRSRGIPEPEARALLIEAFLAETIPDGLPEELHSELIGMMRGWLAESPPESPAVQA